MDIDMQVDMGYIGTADPAVLANECGPSVPAQLPSTTACPLELFSDPGSTASTSLAVKGSLPIQVSLVTLPT